MVYPICHLLVLGSACCNPLLYGWLNDNFRREFIKALCCCSKAKAAAAGAATGPTTVGARTNGGRSAANSGGGGGGGGGGAGSGRPPRRCARRPAAQTCGIELEPCKLNVERVDEPVSDADQLVSVVHE